MPLTDTFALRDGKVVPGVSYLKDPSGQLLDIETVQSGNTIQTADGKYFYANGETNVMHDDARPEKRTRRRARVLPFPTTQGPQP